MEIERYDARRRLDPAGLGFALIATGLVLLGLATAAPKVVANGIGRIIQVIQIDAPKPPPPPPPQQPVVRHQPTPSQIARVDQTIKVPPIDLTPPVTTVDITRIVDVPPPTDTGMGGGDASIAPPPPVLTGTAIDPRYADALQPPYPPEERRMSREGRVVVRVLIGPDGRVTEVERISATSDAFFDVTRRQALAKWRFRPATRDGVPIAAWRQMSVTFRLEDGDQ